MKRTVHPSAGDLSGEIADIVADAISTALRGASDPADDLEELIPVAAAGAIEGAVEIGASIVHAARGTLMAIARSTPEHDADVLRALWCAGSALLRRAHELGCDPAAVTQGAIEGALAVAAECRLDPLVAAITASNGALDAASEAGAATADRVRETMAILICRIGSIDPDPTPGAAPTQ